MAWRSIDARLGPASKQLTPRYRTGPRRYPASFLRDGLSRRRRAPRFRRDQKLVLGWLFCRINGNTLRSTPARKALIVCRHAESCRHESLLARSIVEKTKWPAMLHVNQTAAPSLWRSDPRALGCDDCERPWDNGTRRQSNVAA